MPSHALPDNQTEGKRYAIRQAARTLTPTFLLLSCLGSWMIAAPMAMAQVTPDGSLSTTVNANGNNFTIENGDRVGNNLFHSFREFSIPTNGAAFFNNAADVQNIFSRVTGGNISNIDGLIRANGGANLFLLNPAGIVFGPNAKLNIGGSFFGTTANSIRFADGVEFSATTPSTSPLLTVSVPIGLQMGANPGAITVRGSGHQLKVANPSSPYTRRDTGRLQVSPGHTLAMLGGDVTLTGGTLTAPSGRIELGAVENGQVALNLTPQGFTLDYSGVTNFRNLQLLQTALADVSGEPSGSVQLQGRQVSLRDGSVVWSQNRGSTQGGNIEVRGSESIEINGFTPNGNPSSANRLADANSALLLEVRGSGAGGDIRASAPQIRILNGGGIEYKNFSPSPAGSFQVHATESIQMDGSWTDTRPTYLLSGTFGDGLGADVIISTPQLNVLNGANASVRTVGKGNGGNLTIDADRVVVDGTTASRQASSRLSLTSFSAGNAGNFTLNTRTLTLSNSGEIGTSSISSGNAGLFVVNATESVLVTGGLADALNPSQIRSAVITPSPSSQRIFGIEAVPKGNAGGVTINTPSLAVTDRARVSVRNEGIGNGGTLAVNADSIRLDNGGSLTATTNLGEGGNIAVSSGMLVIRRGSSITTTAGGTVGSGGNITIDSPTIVGLENSDIIANAVQGRGGNINITTQGIFGLVNRSQLTRESDITASSQFGLSGTINVSVLNVNQQNVVEHPPSNFVSTDQVVANRCLARQGNSQGTFIIAGNGGLPETPETATIPYEVVQVRATQTPQATPRQQESKATPTWKPGDPIVEATEFRINAQGQVVLTANGNSGARAIAQPQSIPCQPN